MTKGEETKGQSMNYKALSKTLKPEQQEGLRGPTLELSTLGCSSTRNNTLHVLQHLLRPALTTKA
jgi:hypothetical protein